MSRFRVRAERVREVAAPPVRESPEALDPYLGDASGAPRGHAAGLVRPASEAEAAAFLRGSEVSVLPQAAHTSLTGGAIPQGEVVLSVEALRDCGAIERRAGAGARATFGAGVRLRELQEHVGQAGFYFPPVPTYREAMIGGTASTNAGGAATFKYGATRRFVHSLRVLLWNGDLLVLERGQVLARPGESFAIELSDGRALAVPAPRYRLPALDKLSAGYFASDPLDLVDLFVGAEGTLGLITAVTVELVPKPPAVVTGLVLLADEDRAFALGVALREAARTARARGDVAGPDVRAIEWLDAHCLEILRESGDAQRGRVALPPEARAGLLFELELPEPLGNEKAQERIAAALNGGGQGRDDGLLRLFRILREHQAVDTLEFAFPEDETRQRALSELREAVPQRVAEHLARRPSVTKAGGDLIVPFEQLDEMMRVYASGFERRGLRYAVWGHFADGNLHPNALPEDAEGSRRAVEALFEFAAEAGRRGGSPLSEHGVGRSPIKQRMLREFLGAQAVAEMRAIKRALDPPGRFAPGLIFPA